MVKKLLAMEETWVQPLGREDPLEEEMVVIHSSILAWKIPRSRDPGTLQSTGSQRIRHDWVPNSYYVDLDSPPRKLQWVRHTRHPFTLQERFW